MFFMSLDIRARIRCTTVLLTFTAMETEYTSTTYCPLTVGMEDPQNIPDKDISTNDETAPGSLR